MSDLQTMENEKNIVQFRPYTDILEKENGFYIVIDVPGVSKETLSLDLKENELEVRAKALYPFIEGYKEVHTEFGDGEYIRSFTLSDSIDREKIQASLKNGVLELFLPKAEKLKPRKIHIAVEE